MKDAIKIKPDKRYIARMSLNYAIFLIALMFLLFFLKPYVSNAFISGSMGIAFGFYLVFLYPKITYIGKESISFVKEYDSLRLRVDFADIVNMEVTTKPYNTVTITTLAGATYRLHPEDPQPFIDMF